MMYDMQDNSEVVRWITN